jgi:hypothetical protein
MSFLESERRRLVAERDSLFKDPGAGAFSGKPREFVLSEASGNLWEGIRADAIEYFRRNRIPWWKGAGDDPTGHMLSSQIACVNHLYALRQRPELAKVLLSALDGEVVDAELVDDGYVEFEFIGDNQYLKERAFSRGANCTSIDAFMIGRTADRKRRAFLIEWKYTESYQRVDKYIPERAQVYDHLIRDARSPFKTIEPRSLYFEPFYQMMRQTLLGWQIGEHKDHGCTSYRHVHVVPDENFDFHQNVTSPDLSEVTVSDAWRSVLKAPEHYIGISPASLMAPIATGWDTKSLTTYLRRRYWPVPD